MSGLAYSGAARWTGTHQSTAELCPRPLITSGQMYSAKRARDDISTSSIISARGAAPKPSPSEQRAPNSPSVPTNEFVLKSAMQLLVSTSGTPFGVMSLIAAGAPPFPFGSDCFERSKSESMMWPVSWRRMSARGAQMRV